MAKSDWRRSSRCGGRIQLVRDDGYDNTALDTFRRSFAQEESRRFPMFNEQYAYGFRVPKN